MTELGLSPASDSEARALLLQEIQAWEAIRRQSQDDRDKIAPLLDAVSELMRPGLTEQVGRCEGQVKAATERLERLTARALPLAEAMGKVGPAVEGLEQARGLREGLTALEAEVMARWKPLALWCKARKGRGASL